MTHGYQRKASPPWETATKAAVSKAKLPEKLSPCVSWKHVCLWHFTFRTHGGNRIQGDEACSRLPESTARGI